MKQVAHGQGWTVYRLGRSHCVQIGDVEFWLTRDTDIARQSALGQIQALHPDVMQPALEALGAKW